MAPKRKANINQSKSPKTPAKRRRTDTGTDNNQAKITEYYRPLSLRQDQVPLKTEAKLPNTSYPSQVNIQDLPSHLLQAVFSYLPIQQLCLHVKCVCRSWREIISNPEFLPWRKLYYNYQQGDIDAKQQVQHYLFENNITKENKQCVINLIRFLSPKFEACEGEISRFVRGHRLYDQAKDCMRTTQLLNSIKAEYKWVGLVVLMLLLADGVEDVEALVFHLESSSCPLSHTNLSELLWALSTLLLAMTHTGIRISSRLHYNVFYVLFQMENTAPPVEGSRGTGEKQLQMTHEQQCIINHNMQPSHVVKVEAFAGTGKTNVLIKFSQQRPNLRLLYVTFNNAVAKKARRWFPKNVECRTIHSLAYNAVGKRYNTLKKVTDKMKLFFLSKILPEGKRGYVNAKVVSQTIDTFCQSTDSHISTKHVPLEYKNTNGLIQTTKPHEKREFVNIAKDVWSKIIKEEPREHHAYCITHDGYLKLWQLQKPILKQYDIIMIDEAQDCSPVIMDIWLSQPCAKIFVGDPHQQIYAFKGAVNALHTISHTHLYYLTQSFRFGSEIAYTGTAVLDACKKVKRSLLGAEQDGSVCGDDSEVVDSLRSGSGKGDGRIAVLCRKNVTVFSEAARLVQANPECKIHFIGGVLKLKLKDIEDIWTLKSRRQWEYVGYSQSWENRNRKEFRNPFIQHFSRHGGFEALQRYATESEDEDLTYKLTVVKKYGTQIPHLVSCIIASATKNIQQADFILGTVHKSKGLEFHTVIMADDFKTVPRAASPLRVSLPRDVQEDEWNLLYIAVTRAKRKLFLNKTIISILEMKGHCFLQSGMIMADPPFVCCAPYRRTCGMVNGIAMRKMPVTYVCDQEGSAVSWKCEDGGLLCTSCVKRRLGVLSALLAIPSSTS
ncbi:F-box DNA helicase 1-like [Colossoma macropomum]|uniref:F-box DNA helicase 1-like n=1 Tax=Colossoma macropomum TaxID=42526 RepID=UPI001863BE00|nr:F-box DNA helicase 1-like [Colossoma macropomum]